MAYTPEKPPNAESSEQLRARAVVLQQMKGHPLGRLHADACRAHRAPAAKSVTSGFWLAM